MALADRVAPAVAVGVVDLPRVETSFVFGRPPAVDERNALVDETEVGVVERFGGAVALLDRTPAPDNEVGVFDRP